MYAPPGAGAQPIARDAPPSTPPGAPGPPGGKVAPGGSGGLRPGSSPHYALAQGAGGGGGGLDQPLSDKFHQLAITSAPGSGSSSTPQPEQIPRPQPNELAECLRWEAQGGQKPHDQCHPKFMRMTVNAMPISTSAKTKAGLPLGAIIQPLARADDVEVPIVNFGQSGVVRCGRCRTYINAFVNFADGGRKWRCNVCGKLNDVPADYFCELDGDGRRRDRMERPELHMGTTEFVAAAEYMVRPPQPPVFLFLMEVSYAAVASGMLRCVAATLQHTIQHLPGGERTQVGPPCTPR